MSIPTIEERTLYPPIITYLSELGFVGIQEVGVGKKYPDIIFSHGQEKFIIEVEIGQMKELLEGIIQARNYAEKVGTENAIVIIYPPEIRRPLFIPETLEPLALETRVSALILTKYWKDHFIREKCVPLKEILIRLKDKLVKHEKVVSLDLVIDTIGECITELSDVLRSLSGIQKEKLVNTVVGKFDLFLSLGETAIAEKEDLELASLDLASYILVNQILFYHIYSQLTTGFTPLQMRVDQLSQITSIDQLSTYFKQIRNINYEPIYSINIVSEIPRMPAINKITEKLVEAVKVLEPEAIKHDLLGRLFHELLPLKTRKILAAFYTRPTAAEILATLTIDRSHEKVIDLACGSGTLLVAAYRRKVKLLGPVSTITLMKVHTKFVEEDIFGADLMPFASHLSAINLSAQNLNVTTNKVNIVGRRDSLFLRPGQHVKPYEWVIERRLDEVREKLEELTTSGSPVLFEKCRSVIMNPPFTDREKLPDDYRKKLNTDPSLEALRKICGAQVNYWGYFITLADFFLEKIGKLGVVIPISIFKGNSTLPLRKYLLENYALRYIVKVTKNIAFTEGAAFRDILLVAEKRKPSDSDLTGIIFIKKRIDELSPEEARCIAEEIREILPGVDKTTNDYEVYWVTHSGMLSYKEHMMPIIAFQSVSTRDIILNFLKRALQKEKIEKIEEKVISEGFHTSPAGLSQIVFITRPKHESRIGRAFLTLEKENGHIISAKSKRANISINVERDKIMPALRTGTGIETMDINGNFDYIITGSYKGYDDVKRFSKWDREIRWERIRMEAMGLKTHLSFICRINPYSPNTHLMAFYSDDPYIPSDLLKAITTKSKDDAKILALILNSTFFLSQVFLYKEEATGTYPHVRTEDLVNMHVLKPTGLSKQEGDDLLKLFEKIKNVKFPSLQDQLSNRFWARVEMDKAILKILGFTEEETENWLNRVYDALLKEMKDFMDACKA